MSVAGSGADAEPIERQRKRNEKPSRRGQFDPRET